MSCPLVFICVIGFFLNFGRPASLLGTDNQTGNAFSQPRAKIVYYEFGKPVEIDGEKEGYSDQVVNTAEKLFSQADSGYKLIVTEQVLDGIRRGKAIEITYLPPKKMIIRGNTDMLVKRLLIPLEGKFARSGATVFYGCPEYGEFNVVFNSKGKASLDSLSEAILRIVY